MVRTKARVKMADVAAAAGVSTMTVSRALRHDGTIAPATRRRILDVVSTLGYVPDRMAASFSSQKSGFVAVLVPSLNNTHFAETAAGLQEVLTPAGIQMLLGYTNYRAEVAERLIETMLERRPEAIIVTYDDHTKRARQLLTAADIPVIEIWETPTAPIGHVVGFSNRHAANEMTQHLVASGRRNIGFIGEAHDTGTRGAERRKGFIDAMRHAGLDPRRRISIAAPPMTMMHGREAMQALIKKWPDTDAVLCVSDPAAFGAITACQIAGRRVPEDIAVAGFGGFEISQCAIPAITTIDVSGLEIGTRAGELALRALSGDATAIETILIDAKPRIRASTRAS